MGGFLTSYFGYIPKTAEKCSWNNFTFEIVDMDRARIDKILVTRTSEPAEASAPTPENEH
jgi:putative hemolysin